MCAEALVDGVIVRRAPGVDYQVSRALGATAPAVGVTIGGGASSVYTRVVHLGTTLVVSGAAFAEGDRLTADSVGRAIKATGVADNFIGYALEAATAADQQKELFVCPGGSAGDTILTNSVAGVDPASLTTGTSTTTATITVTGAALGDYAWGSFSLDLQGIVLSVWVSVANTVSYRFCNFTGSTINLSAGTVKVWVRK